MSWKPRHEAHAIERVRVLLAFKDPLTSKLLSSATNVIASKSKELGFDSVLPAESAVAMIKIDITGGSPEQDVTKNGTLLQRHVDGRRIEEVGFRDGGFGYLTLTYGRWENLRGRLEEVVYPALQLIQAAAELKTVKLEYWDSFQFEGPPDKADIDGLLDNFQSSLPKEVLSGGSQWHSHIGWFENSDFGPVLINRNFDVADRKSENEEKVRVLTAYSMVEQRGESGQVPFDQVDTILTQLHDRSLLLFGEALTNEYREQIGIDLDNYK